MNKARETCVCWLLMFLTKRISAKRLSRYFYQLSGVVLYQLCLASQEELYKTISISFQVKKLTFSSASDFFGCCSESWKRMWMLKIYCLPSQWGSDGPLWHIISIVKQGNGLVLPGGHSVGPLGVVSGEKNGEQVLLPCYNMWPILWGANWPGNRRRLPVCGEECASFGEYRSEDIGSSRLPVNPQFLVRTLVEGWYLSCLRFRFRRWLMAFVDAGFMEHELLYTLSILNVYRS